MTTRIPLIALLTASILVGLGCTTTQINPGTETSATYRFGALNAMVGASMDATYQAAEQATQSLGLNVVQKLSDKLESRIIARDAQDKKVTILLLSVAPDKTKLTINVQPESKATRIYQTIVDQLAKK
ncbi:MAG: hypothetical protein A2Y76_09895 [Planctomycetes bacterium RBG_13_60_9]|nr:MAG: hypothetical protein A2Y76_09895 [Planctomycetes bacterium RBG_13_60_9]